MRAKTRRRFQFLDSIARWSKHPVLHRLLYQTKTLIGGVRCCQMKRKKKLPLERTGKKKSLVRKAVFPALSEAEIEEWCRPFVPKNTQNNTGWAVCNFNEWQSAFNTGKSDDEKCPEFLLETCEDAGTLCRWLCRFVTSTRRSDGEQYTPTSIHSLLAGLYRYMKEKNPHSDEMNFMDKKDKKFKELHCVCDRLYRELRKKGIGLRTSNSS